MSRDERDLIIERTLARYGRLIRKISMEIIDDAYEAEDIIQTALTNVIYKYPNEFDTESNEYKNYLCTSVKNTAINTYNKLHGQGGDIVSPFEIEALTMDHVDMIAFQDKYGFSQEMHELLGMLDNVDRDIICLKYGAGYSDQQVATAVGKSVAAVRKREQRARIKLQNILIDRDSGGGENE